jgi:hypothetical protein
VSIWINPGVRHQCKEPGRLDQCAGRLTGCLSCMLARREHDTANTTQDRGGWYQTENISLNFFFTAAVFFLT